MSTSSSNGDRLSHGSQGGVEGISDLLCCYICTERLTNATICPYCSKIGCFNCMKKWISENRSNCPHCRMVLSMRDLIKIPLFDDLGQYLDTLRISKKAGSNSPTGDRERCPKHKEKMTVYCESCKRCICHMCALFGGEHNEHKFKPLDELYRGVKEKLNSELCNLKDRMKEVLNAVQIIEKKMDAVKVTKSKTKREMQHTVEKLCGRLDDQAKEKLALLSDQRHHLKKQALDIAAQSHELQKIMVEGNIASLVGPDGELKAEVQDMLQRLKSSAFPLSSLPSSSDFINEVTPTYDTGIFKIHPFCELQRRGEELYSKPLKVHGLTWRLKVYPNGHREDNGNYLSVFVELYDGFDRTTRYQYSIEMLYNCGNKHPHKNYRREYASEFANGECWGYKKYYELARLEEEGFLKENTLILRFNVRAPTYYHKCRDLTEYVEKVELDKEKLKKELDSAKEEVAKLKHTIQTSASHTSPTHSASSHHLSSRRSHSQSQHQHDPPQSQRHSNHERQSSDELRRYYHHSASQQPLRSHSHHASPKRTYIQSAGHSDSRLVAEHHYPPPPGVVMVGRRRSREEHEEVGGAGGRYVDQRRKSAEPALLVNYDPTAPPPFRGTSSSSGYNMTAPGEMSGNKEKRSSRLPFEDPGSDEGSSQSCDIVNPSGITFTLEETDVIKSASSSSTLVENSSGSPLPRQPDITAHKSPREQQLSQETFTEDDRQNLMVILSPLREGVPLSSQPHYYDPSFNQPPPYFGGLSQPSPPKSRHGKSLTDISSATAVAPMAAMGGNSNLLALQRQYLSQSVELPHLTQHTTGQRYATDSLPRHARLVTQPQQQQQQQQGHGLKHTQSVPLNQMYRMASDSHLNYDGPPGQKMSVAGALARVKEEIEQQKKQPQLSQQQQAPSQARQRGGQNHMRKQTRSHHLQKKHVQATVVSPQANRPKTSSSGQEKSSPKRKPERSPSATTRSQKPSSSASSSTGNSPSSPTKMAIKPSSKRSILSSSTATRDLVLQGKSKSTSSLNLELL